MQIKLADNQSLKSAATRYGNSIKTYDDGFGPLWVIQNSMGIEGIVRAESWEDAWSTAEDEIFPRANEEDVENFEKDYGPDWMDDGCWNESYGFSGSNGIYEKDINGDYLNPLTTKNCEEWGITLEIETEVEPLPADNHFCWHTGNYTNQNGRSVFTMHGRYGASWSKVYYASKYRTKRPMHSHYAPQNDDLTLILNP